MIAAYIDKRNKTRTTFTIDVCETCNIGGKIHGTVVKSSMIKATFILSRPVPTLFEKVDVSGNRYDRLCGRCINKIEMIEAKRAGDKEVAEQ